MSDEPRKLPTSRWEKVTPEKAIKWLEGNLHNRRLSQKAVDRLARDMLRGSFEEVHQGIAFDVDGMLYDGQHRLWAVVQSNVTVWMFVARNMSKRAIWATDIGGRGRRTAPDVLTMTGQYGDVTRTEIAVLRAMIRGLAGSDKGQMSDIMTVNEEGEALAKHRDAVAFACEHLRSKASGTGNANVKAVIARAFYGGNHDKLIRFCEVLTTAEAENQNERIIVSLWKYLVQSKSGAHRPSRQEIYSRTERALQAYIRGTRLAQLKPATQELFPLPEEVAPA